jgi:hypothetical protein
VFGTKVGPENEYFFLNEAGLLVVLGRFKLGVEDLRFIEGKCTASKLGFLIQFISLSGEDICSELFKVLAIFCRPFGEFISGE